jgi:hypothetical protein
VQPSYYIAITRQNLLPELVGETADVRGVEGHVLQAEARRGAHAHAQRRGQRARPQATAQHSKVNVSLWSLSTSGSHQWTSAHATIDVADAQKTEAASNSPLLAAAGEQRLHLNAGLAADVQSALSLRTVHLSAGEMDGKVMNMCIRWQTDTWRKAWTTAPTDDSVLARKSQ